MNVQFVPAKCADLETLMQVHTRAFAAENVESGSVLPGCDDLKWHRYSFKHHHYFKILMDEKIGGTIVVEKHGDGVYFLNTLCVAPEYQRRGIGKAAMTFIETHFADARKWTLNVTERNTGNQKFYESFGYVKRGLVFYIDPKKLDAWMPLLLYEKEIESRPSAERNETSSN